MLKLWTLATIINFVMLFRMFYTFKKQMGFINIGGAAFLLFWSLLLGPVFTMFSVIAAIPEKEKYDPPRKLSKAE